LLTGTVGEPLGRNFSFFFRLPKDAFRVPVGFWPTPLSINIFPEIIVSGALLPSQFLSALPYSDSFLVVPNRHFLGLFLVCARFSRSFPPLPCEPFFFFCLIFIPRSISFDFVLCCPPPPPTLTRCFGPPFPLFSVLFRNLRFSSLFSGQMAWKDGFFYQKPARFSLFFRLKAAPLPTPPHFLQLLPRLVMQ